MNYVWTHEPKHFPIRSARKPEEGKSLSGVVLVVEKGVGTCYVRFTDDLVEKLGKKMPRGIGPASQAYIKVIKRVSHYDVFCVYTDKQSAIPLWRTDTLPEWIKRVRYPDATTETNGRRRGAGKEKAA